ncbi:MAG: AMP-binding protein [Verrucomicrobiota bacterium]
METAEEQLLTPHYWADPKPDLRLNPQAPFDDTGLPEVLESSVRLCNHVIFSTSGSSGSPKLVCISKSSLMASAQAVNSHLEVTSEDRWLCALPTFHVGGFGIWARAFAAEGMALSYPGKWDARRFTETCLSQKISLTSLVAVQVFDLVQAGLRCPNQLRAVIVGGSALSEDLGQQARDLGWPVLQSFGMTESSSQIATQALSSLQLPHKNAEIPMLPCWEARTNDDNLLEIRGAPLFGGYLEQCSGTWRFTSPFDEDGWFTTEDRVTLSGNAITPQGRDGRTVKILGELLNLDRLESLLLELSGRNSEVVALETIPDPRTGERLVLVTERSVPGPVIAQLRDRFDQQVAPFEMIGEVRTVDQLPRSPLGKIQRRQLRDWLRRNPSP